MSVTDGPLLWAAEHFLYDIYIDSGFCRPTPRRVVEELEPWRSRSTFHLVIDEQDGVIGSVRTITGGWSDLPAGDFVRHDWTHPDPLCELSSLAILPSNRSTGIVEHIYRAGWIAAWRSGAHALVGLVDPWLLELFTDHYQLPFTPIGAAKFHMGGTVIPVAMPLVGAAYEPLAAGRVGFWTWTLEAATPEEIQTWNLPAPAR